MSEPARLLIVDDDVRLNSLLARYLEENQFIVSSASDSQQMDNKLNSQSFDLMVLDLMLPGEDGLSICSRLRATGNTIPIIMLTAKGDEIDRIIGLEIGADDYLPKPCNPRELMARIRAVIRRHDTSSQQNENNEQSITFGQFTLHAGIRELETPDETVHLTGCETGFLHALLSHPNQALSRERLMILARGKDHDVFDRSIDVQISRLRKLLEDNPKQPKLIQTVWGIGYIFVPPESSP